MADKDYSHRPVAAKLGIKDGMRVCILGAPPGFADALGPLPGNVTLTGRPDAAADLFLCVVRRSSELAAYVNTLPAVVERQTLWLIWPKKATSVKSDVDGNVVRDAGVASGWVDFKVCSVNDVWSALAFKRRKRETGGAAGAAAPPKSVR